MKKKFLSILFVVACICLSLGLAACKGAAFAVTVKEGTGYTVQGLNAAGYNEGDEVAFTVTVTDDTKQVKEVSADEQVLTAQSNGGYKFTMPAKDVEISVVLENKKPQLSLSSSSLVLNAKTADSQSVTATITPNQDGLELEWASADNSIATVTPNGKTAEITAVGKGTTKVTVSIKGVEGSATEIAVSVANFRPWTTAEETAMKEHLYGIVLYPTELDEMEAKWDAKYTQITVEGDWVEGNGLAEYASQYTAQDGWQDVTHLYNVTEGTAYMFEKAVEVAQEGTRYVRVFIYAISDASSGDLGKDGEFYITAYDPYVYEWPTAYLAAAVKDVLSTTAIPSVSAQHYYLNNYGVTAYYTSDKADGGYGAILEAAGYTVKQEDGYYSAVSPDELFGLVYIYKDGALEISMTYLTTEGWPAKLVANAFNYYNDLGVTAFVLPEFEGEGVSFMFADGYYNKFWVNEGKERDIYGTITVKQSTEALTQAYIQKLLDNGWISGGTKNVYIKPIADSEMVNKIKVSFEADKTLIDIYYFSVKDPTKGWNDDTIKENHLFYKYVTDTIPEYTGEITAFSADKEFVYITVPAADFATLQDTYIAILEQAGFVLTGTSTWTQKYVSPNGQYGIRLSTPSGKENTLSLYILDEKPCEWDNQRIKDYLQDLGSSLESIPEFECANDFVCAYSYIKYTPYYKITLTASDSEQKLSQEDFDAYKAKLVADEGWTQKTEGGNVFVASDGTTITLSYSSYSGSISIEIKYVAPAA